MSSTTSRKGEQLRKRRASNAINQKYSFIRRASSMVVRAPRNPKCLHNHRVVMRPRRENSLPPSSAVAGVLLVKRRTMSTIKASQPAENGATESVAKAERESASSDIKEGAGIA